MSVGDQHSRITKPFDSEHLEELANQSVRAPTDSSESPSDPRPTCKIHKDELLGLLDMSDRMASSPDPAEPRPAHMRLVPAGSTSHEPDHSAAPEVAGTSSDNDDRQTQRMQAKHFRALVEGGLPITPAVLESIDWYRETDAAAERARMPARAPEAILDELGRESPDSRIAEPVRSSEQRPHTPRPEARASIAMPPLSMPPLSMPGEPGRDDAKPGIHRTTSARLPPARSDARLRIWIGLIVLAIVAIVGVTLAI